MSDLDFRKRCEVRRGAHSVLYYGLTAADYEMQMGFTDARNVTDTFDHSAGEGRRRSPWRVQEPPRYFFTPELGKEPIR
jgi:hypothetical protein